jgi:hypothetical protein
MTAGGSQPTAQPRGQVDEENLHTALVLGPHRFAFPRDLLPESACPADPVPGETRSRRRS